MSMTVGELMAKLEAMIEQKHIDRSDELQIVQRDDGNFYMWEPLSVAAYETGVTIIDIDTTYPAE
jgi:hypothetical protein